MEENTKTTQTPPAETKKEKNIGMAVIAYILFFVPLLTEMKNDPFVKYHVKQGLLLLISCLIASAFSFLPFFGWFLSRILNFGLFILMIMGIVNAINSKKEPMPLIGKFADQFKF